MESIEIASVLKPMAEAAEFGQRMTEELKPRISERAREIRPFIVMEVFERARELESQGRSIIHMELGEPDFETPEIIREAGIRAIRDGKTRYTHSLGHPELREAIADWHLEQYGVRVSPDQIVVTVGSSAAMLLASAVLLDSGEKVVLPDPGYACYSKFIRAVDGIPVNIEVEERDGFHFCPHRVENALQPDVRAVVINSPSNPTGTVIPSDRISRLVSVVEGRAVIISDEIYHGLVYEDRARSILEFTRYAVVINGFSKLFSMTGWRLGYAIFPQGMIRPVQRLQQNLFISAPDFAQHAGVVALRQAQSDVEKMRLEYDRRRRFILRSLHEIGLLPAVEPTGAFYVFVNVGSFTENVYEFAFRILEVAGVAVTPGIDFGPHGEGFIRICYANSMGNLEEGMRRLSNFFQGRRNRTD